MILRHRTRLRVASAQLSTMLFASSVLGQPAPAPEAPPAPVTTAPAPAEGEPYAEPPTPVPLGESLTGMAKAEYEGGKVLYIDGDFAGALLKFKAAHELTSDARLLWNMAAAEKNLRHYARVLELLERYKAEGGALLTTQDIADADQLIEVIRPFVATVFITSNQSSASVTLDGEPAGATPLPKPLVVDMGKHVIRVAKAGFVDFVQTGEVKGGTEVRIQASLEEARHVGMLVIQAHPTDSIAIDGAVVGKGGYKKEMPSGTHRIVVTGEGKQPYETNVVIEDDQTNTVQVRLKEVLQESSSTWLWVSSGVALAVGLGVGGFLLLKPEDKSEPPVQGTIPPGVVPLPFTR